MKHYIISSLLLVGLADVAHGQNIVGTPPTTPSLGAPAPASIAPTRIALDTAAALHHYFARRRHNGHITLGVGGGLLAVGYTTVAVNNKGGDLASILLGVLGTVVSVPLLVRGIILTVRHSEGQEHRVLQAWQQHHLPNRWARRALAAGTQPEISQ